MTQLQDGGPAFPPTFGMSGEIGEGMSQRAFAAINLRVPDSGIDWLDAMILQAKRDEIAGQALSGLLAGYWGNSDMCGLGPTDIASSACDYADAMIAERNKP